jgi:aminoglycoside 3-N-acetyltransferase
MGAITEELRTRPGALRSLEPTHSVAALGPNAHFLVEDHVNADGSCDEHSPLYRLTQLPRGYVLLLGVDFRNCTLLHTAEELARVPFVDFTTHYRLRGRTRRFFGASARHPLVSSVPTVLLSRTAYALSIYCHSTPLRANFPAIEPVLLDRHLLTMGHVGSAYCRLARAADILTTPLDCLKADPYFLRVREARE